MDRKQEGKVYQGEICKKCGREQRIAWSVTNDLWEAVVSPEFKNKTLCLECFLEMADEKEVDIKLKDFVFLGWVGENIVGDVLIERGRRIGIDVCRNPEN